jgi:acyl-CoA-binding protein
MVSAQFTAAANAAKQLKAKPTDDELLQVCFLLSIFDPSYHQPHLKTLRTPHPSADAKG